MGLIDRLAGAWRRHALGALLAWCGVAAAQEEVPFITTPDAVTVAMLELAGVGPADHVIDLGSGDGRIVITAARRFGASGLGVEIVPELVQRSRAFARAAGVVSRTEFREQDLFATDLSRATVVTMYLLPEVNLQLRPRLLALAPGTRIVSHDWDLGDWVPERSRTLDVPDKAIGRDKRSRVLLWIVPAAVQGTWCSAGARLEVTQRFQHFSATLVAASLPGQPALVFDGRIEGRTLHVREPHEGRWHAEPEGLRAGRLNGTGAAWSGRLFTPAGAGVCR
jgi:SAM-dependent methyltransferase